jgi:hypothetical protein
MEKQLYTEAGIQATIHMDPIVTDDPMLDELRTRVAALICELDGRMTMHDFRMVKGNTHSNLIFDVVVPFEVKESNADIKAAIDARIKTIDQSLCTVITVDRA